MLPVVVGKINRGAKNGSRIPGLVALPSRITPCAHPWPTIPNRVIH